MTFKVGDTVTYNHFAGGWPDHNVPHGTRGTVTGTTTSSVSVQWSTGRIGRAHDPAYLLLVAPALDLTKPVQTRDGRAVRILCTDGPEGFPVVGLIAGGSMPQCWTSTGSWSNRGEKNIADLVNVPEPKAKVTTDVYLYRYTAGGKLMTATYPVPAHHATLLGKASVTIEEGEGLN